MTEDKDIKKSEVAKKEEETLIFWKENKIFEKSLEKSKDGKEYVFYDGPPFATGLPHYGHILASTIKDAVPRYKTMRGMHVERRWGWDCHGLPIENIVEKELNISGKKDIEKIGIEKFNEVARSRVLTFAGEWKKTIERIARWVDFDGSYKTMDNTYIESVWWALSKLYKKKMLYEGQKVLLYCPRCETPVSKAETAMDHSYKNITEEAITVKFKVKDHKKANLPENTYFLAWTTTPWTLPGNVALAVGKDIDYMIAGVNGEYVILSIDQMKSISNTQLKELKEQKIVKGSDLVGVEYEPLFELSGTGSGDVSTRYVTDADFVTTDEGTGIVHTAVMYGEDDYNLGLKLGLPQIQMLDERGHFNENAPNELQGLYFKKAEKVIKDILVDKELVFSRGPYKHSYPHCWRCGTQLFYNAVPSWFIKIDPIRKKLLKLNKKVKWVPEHLKDGRFRNNILQAPDWNISRNRYWASPLPIWKCDACSKATVLGSVNELYKKSHGLITKIIFVRHGESVKNIQGVLDSTLTRFALTKTGVRQARRTGRQLKKESVDVVLSSPVRRARETAEIIGKKLKLGVDVIDNLAEINSGKWEEMTYEELSHDVERNKYTNLPFQELYENKRGKTGESWQDLDMRINNVINYVTKKYSGKTIVLVTHQGNIVYAKRAIEKLDLAQAGKLFLEEKCKGYVIPFRFYLDSIRASEFDLHRPYIDAVTFPCELCKGTMRRVSEVVDAWFESGSMPYAHVHYPFENIKWLKKHFPAQFITEYVPQTRTWFYYTHTLAATLFNEHAFENVVTTGTVLAEDGQKMSKSKGNFPNPWYIFNKYGVDATRYYLLSSPLMRSEDLKFSEREIDDIYKKIILRLRNVLSFFNLYKVEVITSHGSSQNVLDRWILIRLRQLDEIVTSEMDNYFIEKAMRPIGVFVEDLSLWYVRRSRSRFKSEDKRDRDHAIQTLAHVLLQFSKIIAPFMPFIAENIYKDVSILNDNENKESVHLCTWPIFSGKQNPQLLSDMAHVRQMVEQALSLRQETGLKVRQPLASITLKDSKLRGKEELIGLLLEEINVKKILFDASLSVPARLDVRMTDELILEGRMRELVRGIQEKRKHEGFVPDERVRIYIGTDTNGEDLVRRYVNELTVLLRATNIELRRDTKGADISDGRTTYTVAIES